MVNRALRIIGIAGYLAQRQTADDQAWSCLPSDKSDARHPQHRAPAGSGDAPQKQRWEDYMTSRDLESVAQTLVTKGKDGGGIKRRR
jgi:hypothetical protein